MNELTQRALIFAALVLATSVLPRTARANDGPRPFIFELVQQGQDVQVTLGLDDPQGYSLVREGDDYRKVLFKNRALTEGVEPTWFCWVPGYLDECEEPDSGCFDCNGDGTNECYEGCVEFYFVDYLDECVYPGETAYALGGEKFHEIEGEIEGYWTTSIDVTDTGEECDYDLDGDDGGCSVVGLGSRPQRMGLLLVLAALGLGVLLSGRVRN